MNSTKPEFAASGIKLGRLAMASQAFGIASVGLWVISFLLLVVAMQGAGADLFEKLILPTWGAIALFGITAVILSFVAAHRIRCSQGLLAGDKRAVRGRWAGYLGILLVVLTVVLIPFLARARTTSSKNACPNNLRQIDGAKQQWALENKKTDTDTPTLSDLVGTDKYMKDSPICPANGTYTLGNMTTKPRCSIPDHTFP
jgi:hypothetical protein